MPGVWIGTAGSSIEPTRAYKPPPFYPSAEAVARRRRPRDQRGLARDYEEVRRLGSKTSTERTPHQTLMARFREAPDLTPSMRTVADSPGRRPVQNARMFALYQMTLDDAVMVMSESKAHHNFWRPVTAIRNGDQDGNDATPRDPTWTASAHHAGFAEHPCGHCTFAGAIAEVMNSGPARPERAASASPRSASPTR